MDYDEMQSCFNHLGFEIAEIDGQNVLFMDLGDSDEEYGLYALLTDMEGNMPTSAEEPIIWSVYDDNDSFQWSVTIDNASYLKKLFEESDNVTDVLNSLRNLREDHILEFEQFYDV